MRVAQEGHLLSKPGKIETGEALADRRIDILDAAARAFMRQGFAATSLDRVQRRDRLDQRGDLLLLPKQVRIVLRGAPPRHGADTGGDPAIFRDPGFRARPPARHGGRPYDPGHRSPALSARDRAGLELHLLERTNESERAELADVAALREANENLYIRVIRDGVASGEFRSVDAKLAAKPLLGALNWTSRWYQPRPGETQAAKKRVAELIADFVVAGLEKKN